MTDLGDYSTQQLAYLIKSSAAKVVRWEVYINTAPLDSPNYSRITTQLTEETAKLFALTEELQFRRNSVE